MKVEKFSVTSCCGAKSTIFKIGAPIDTKLLQAFVNIGFKESAHFTAVGILYVDNSEFIITGPIGWIVQACIDWRCFFTCSGVISLSVSEIVCATFVKISSDCSISSKVIRILDVSFVSIDSIE